MVPEVPAEPEPLDVPDVPDIPEEPDPPDIPDPDIDEPLDPEPLELDPRALVERCRRARRLCVDVLPEDEPVFPELAVPPCDVPLGDDPAPPVAGCWAWLVAAPSATAMASETIPDVVR